MGYAQGLEPPKPSLPAAERSAGRGCAVVVVEQAVGDEAALRVQGPAGPAQQDLTAGTHLPGARPGPELLPQGTRLLLGPPGALPGQTPALLLRRLAPSLRAGTDTQVTSWEKHRRVTSWKGHREVTRWEGHTEVTSCNRHSER